MALRAIETLRLRGEPYDDLTACMSLAMAHALMFEKLPDDMKELMTAWVDVCSELRADLRSEFNVDLAEYAGEMLKRHKASCVFASYYFALPDAPEMYEVGTFFYVEFRCGHSCVRAVLSGRFEEAMAEGCPYCLKEAEHE